MEGGFPTALLSGTVPRRPVCLHRSRSLRGSSAPASKSCSRSCAFSACSAATCCWFEWYSSCACSTSACIAAHSGARAAPARLLDCASACVVAFDARACVYTPGSLLALAPALRAPSAAFGSARSAQRALHPLFRAHSTDSSCSAAPPSPVRARVCQCFLQALRTLTPIPRSTARHVMSFSACLRVHMPHLRAIALSARACVCACVRRHAIDLLKSRCRCGR